MKYSTSTNEASPCPPRDPSLYFAKARGLVGLCSLIALTGSAVAQDFRSGGPPRLTFSDLKEFTQVGPTAMSFEEGAMVVNVDDGDFTINGCAGNGGTSIFFPSLGCPIGTTAFLLGGDVNGDGEADTRSFWSISNLINAQYIAPGFLDTSADGVELTGAPAGAGILGSGLVTRDISISTFYNVLEQSTQQEYDVTRYRIRRDYNSGQLDDMHDDLPSGNYQFRLPSYRVPGSFEYVNVQRRVFIEGWPGASPVPGLGAFRFTNTNWVGQVLEFDPRFEVTFKWSGISNTGGSSSSTVLPTDRLYFSMRDVSDRIVYPPYADDTPDADRAPIWLQNELYAGQVSIGPFFQLGFFEPGATATAILEVRRGLTTGAGINMPLPAQDWSERTFKVNVRFIDTYEGYAITAFPGGTTDSQIARNFDFDGDGFTNFEEFAFGTDPAMPEDNPSQILLPEIVGNTCTLFIRKRQFTGGRLDYYAEASTDGGATWQRVTASNPDWNIEIDNDAALQLVSSTPGLAPACRIRARVVEAD